MSYIKNTIPKTIHTDDFLVEALRFGNKEKAELWRHKDEFRVGLEFEFHVNEGEDPLENLVNMKSPLADFLSKVDNSVGILAKSVNQLISNINQLRDMAGEFQQAYDDRDMLVIDSLYEYDIDDALSLIKTYSLIMQNSIMISKKDPWDSLLGMGLWDGDATSYDFENVKYVMRNRNSIVLFDEQQKMEFFKRVSNLLLTIYSYTSSMYNRYSNNSTSEIKSLMTNTLKDIFLDANPDGDRSGKRSMIEIVKESHPLPKDWVEKIIPDITVHEGVEIVTRPLSIVDVRTALGLMSDYISKIGSTSNKTGLHVNVSTRNGFKNVNTAKIVTMLDTEFFQNLSPSGKAKFKYDPRHMVGNLYDAMSYEFIERLAITYVNKGQAAFVSEYEKFVNTRSVKEVGVNLEHFFRSRSESTRRIEFRFFSNDLHSDDEIFNDILNVLYAVLVGSSESFMRNQYLSDIVRMIDRYLKRTSHTFTFSDMIRKHVNNSKIGA